MDNKKNSFLIYLDAYTHVLSLPMEQRGELFTALFWYAIVLREKGPMDVTAALSQCPGLSSAGQMAFRFMASNIARDTERWLEKKANYQAAAARRKGESPDLSGKRIGPGPLQMPDTSRLPHRIRGISVYPDEEEIRRMEED